MQRSLSVTLRPNSTMKKPNQDQTWWIQSLLQYLRDKQTSISQIEGSLFLSTCRGNTLKNDLYSPHKLWKMNPSTLLNHYSKWLVLSLSIQYTSAKKEGELPRSDRVDTVQACQRAWQTERLESARSERHQTTAPVLASSSNLHCRSDRQTPASSAHYTH